ncbi:MAG: HAD family hydrolase [Microcystaceae cyanobacterium]
MLRLITDFDGPIMDVSERYYQVYQYCLAAVQDPEQRVTLLSKAQFWQMKRAQVPEIEIGLQSGLRDRQAKTFAHLRKITVHTLPYLVYDQPLPWAIAALEKLQAKGVDLVVMTMRRVCELEEALERNHLGQFFAEDRRYCLANDYRKINDIHDKKGLMAQAMAELPPTPVTWMVGDTEADILAAQSQNIPVIGLLSGIRDRQRLTQHQPTAIANNLEEAVDWLFERVQESAADRLGTRETAVRT